MIYARDVPLLHHDFTVNHRINNIACLGIVDKGCITAVIRLKMRLIDVNDDQIGLFTHFKRTNVFIAFELIGAIDSRGFKRIL